MTTTTTVTAPDGIRLAVHHYGTELPADAPVFLLVHGYPDTHAVWEPVARRLAADGFRVAAHDVRGAGESDAPADRSGYRLERLRDDLAAVADAVSPGRPVHLAGHDWGSVQAWEAVTDPSLAHRIASYTTLSGPCLDHVGHWLRARLRRPGPRNLSRLLHQGAASWYISFFRTPHLPELAWRAGHRLWPALLRRREKAPGARPAPTLREDALRGLELYRANVAERFARPRERHTAVPVQVIALQQDHYVTPALAADLGRWVEDLTIRRLPARHWAPLTHPDTLAAALAGHARSSAPAAGSANAASPPRNSPADGAPHRFR